MYRLTSILIGLKLIARFFYGFVFLARLKARFPSANIETPNTIRFEDINTISFGKNVSVGPYSEIVVLQTTSNSQVPGFLNIDDRVIIGMGANIRAAGGKIQIGEGSMLAQYVSLIAANHKLEKDKYYLDQPLDSSKVGVYIGKNVWLGAGVVVLPGVTIGDNSVIAAGAVVSKSIPSGELWAGVPASYIRRL